MARGFEKAGGGIESARDRHRRERQKRVATPKPFDASVRDRIRPSACAAADLLVEVTAWKIPT
jgi:hypothetical protein